MIAFPDPFQRRLESCRTLPNIPAVAIEILRLCEREDINISQIAKPISRDPALAAKILRVANSAFYCLRSQITTVDRAISFMGTNATLSLSLNFSFVHDLRKSRRGGFDYTAYWRRSAITAAAGQALAEWTKMMNSGELFLAGLLQDIGMLVLNEVFPKSYGKFIVSSSRQHNRLVEIENEKYGTDHGAVGAWMLELWKLPRNLMTSIAASHSPQLLQESKGADYLAVLFLASRIAEIWCNPETAAATVSARQTAIDLLGMSDEKFKMVLSRIADSLPDITRNLDINVGGEEQVKKLLDQAREALVVLNIQAQRQAHHIKTLAETDGLTSLYNRIYLESILLQLFNQAAEKGRHLSMIFIDIDHFKIINDSYGHQTGDSILASVASIISAGLRETDIAARFGGDEFVCLLPETPEEGAKLLAESLRTAIASAHFEVENRRQISVTASLGCAAYSPQCNFGSPAEFLKEADCCLYSAKRRGRDRVISSSSIGGTDGMGETSRKPVNKLK
jgi:diguanylate cyclase (GGDEF)-like protein